MSVQVETAASFRLSPNRSAPYVLYNPTAEPNDETIALYHGIGMQATHWGNLPHHLAAEGYEVVAIGLSEDDRSACTRMAHTWKTMVRAAVLSTITPPFAPYHWLEAAQEIVNEHRPPFTATLDRFAKDAAETMHGVVGKKCRIFGASWGGGLVQQIAKDNPELVESVIGAATFPAIPLLTSKRPKGKALRTVMSPWRNHEDAADIFAGDFMNPELIEDYAGLIQLLERKIKLLPHLEQQQAIALGFILAWRNLFSVITHEPSNIPLDFLYSDDDPLISPEIVELGARILGAEAHLIKSGGHGFMMTRPRQVASKIHEINMNRKLALAA